jgi:hypothetical protein
MPNRPEKADSIIVKTLNVLHSSRDLNFSNFKNKYCGQDNLSVRIFFKAGFFS